MWKNINLGDPLLGCELPTSWTWAIICATLFVLSDYPHSLSHSILSTLSAFYIIISFASTLSQSPSNTVFECLSSFSLSNITFVFVTFIFIAPRRALETSEIFYEPFAPPTFGFSLQFLSLRSYTFQWLDTFFEHTY